MLYVIPVIFEKTKNSLSLYDVLSGTVSLAVFVEVS